MATVDLEEKLLPKGIWLAAIPPVLLTSYLLPQVLGQQDGYSGLMASVAGSLVSGGAVFAMVELGKLLFGRVSMNFDPPEKYELSQTPEGWVVSSAGETQSLSEMMLRPTDSMIIKEHSGTVVRVWETEWENPAGTGRAPLAPHSGLAASLTIPREAMGMGDVKFMLLAGAMLGWEGGLFSVFAGAVLGTCVGLVARMTKGHAEIPFIPFLAAGMVLFMMRAEEIRDAFSSALWGS
jgi:leader peptidase (prepilin peptidase)/N-methyltransferase